MHAARKWNVGMHFVIFRKWSPLKLEQSSNSYVTERPRLEWKKYQGVLVWYAVGCPGKVNRWPPAHLLLITPVKLPGVTCLIYMGCLPPVSRQHPATLKGNLKKHKKKHELTLDWRKPFPCTFIDCKYAAVKNPRKRAVCVHRPTAVPNTGDSQIYSSFRNGRMQKYYEHTFWITPIAKFCNWICHFNWRCLA